MKTDSFEELKALKYPVRIEYDQADNLFVAEFLDLPGCSATGDTVTEAYDRAEEAKREWLQLALEQGLPIPKPSTTEDYSGRVLLRIPTSLHAMVADRARLHGASLNQYLVHLLSAATVQDEVSDKLEEMRGQIERLDWRLAKLTSNLKQLSSYASQASLRANTAFAATLQFGTTFFTVAQAVQNFTPTQQGMFFGEVSSVILGNALEASDYGQTR